MKLIFSRLFYQKSNSQLKSSEKFEKNLQKVNEECWKDTLCKQRHTERNLCVEFYNFVTIQVLFEKLVQNTRKLQNNFRNWNQSHTEDYYTQLFRNLNTLNLKPTNILRWFSSENLNCHKMIRYSEFWM